MSYLDDFLAHDVEGYLFHDLRAMQQISAPQDAPGGGLGYPLLATTLAGIELLGALLSKASFDTTSGARYFKDYWVGFLYPTNGPKPVEVDVLYQLARHGIAHTFLLKGALGVVKGQPELHLTHSADGKFLVDASQLSDDLIASFADRVKPFLDAPTASVDRAQMELRLTEITQKYGQQAAKVMPATPAGAPVSTTTSSSSLASGNVGPSGPVLSNVSSSFAPPSGGQGQP